MKSPTKPYRNNSSFIQVTTIVRLTILFFIVVTGILMLADSLLVINFHADIMTYILIIAFCIGLLLFTKKAGSEIEDRIRLCIGIMVILFFLQRIIVLVILPISFASIGRVGLYSIDEFNHALYMFGVLFLIYWIGIKAGMKLPVSNIRSFVRIELTKIRTAIYSVAVVSLLMKIFLQLLLGWKMGSKWESGWIIRLFPTTLYSQVLMLMWIFYGKQLLLRDKVFIVFYFLISIFSALSQGSKGGIYSVFVIVLFMSILLKGEIYLSRKIIVYIIVAGLVASPILFSLGEQIRRHGRWRVEMNADKVGFTFLAISARLAASTDNFIKAINDWGNREAVKKVLTLRNQITSAVNTLVPGELFPGAKSTGGAWVSYMYGQDMDERVHGEAWSGFGFYYALLGRGVAVAVFIYAMLTTWILHFFLKKKLFVSYLLAVNIFFTMIYDFFFVGQLDGSVRGLLLNSSYILIFIIIASVVIGSFRTVKGENRFLVRS